MRKHALALASLSVACLVVATPLLEPYTTINGQPARTISQDGETYISMTDLKKAGAEIQVIGEHTSVRFKPNPGSTQLDAIQGELGEWLNNGLVRIRFTNPRLTNLGFEIECEVANLTKEPLNPAVNLGMQFPELYGTDGNPIPRTAANNGSFGTEIGTKLTQAATGKATLVYNKPAAEVDRIIVRFDTSNGARQNIIKRLGGFIEPGPNFRVFLKKQGS